MSLQRRLQALETHIGTNDRAALIIAAKDTDAEYIGDCVPATTIIEAAMLAVELGIPIKDITRAKAEYKEEHPDWLGDVSVVVWVNSQETKDALRQTIARLNEG